MRNMSFSLTEAQFVAGEKDVTRRMGWLFLKRGDRVRAVRKAMGLAAGEKIRVLGEIEIVCASRERLGDITQAEVIREGFAEMTPAEFVAMFTAHMPATADTPVTRIEFRKLQPLEVRP